MTLHPAAQRYQRRYGPPQSRLAVVQGVPPREEPGRLAGIRDSALRFGRGIELEAAELGNKGARELRRGWEATPGMLMRRLYSDIATEFERIGR